MLQEPLSSTIPLEILRSSTLQSPTCAGFVQCTIVRPSSAIPNSYSSRNRGNVATQTSGRARLRLCGCCFLEIRLDSSADGRCFWVETIERVEWVDACYKSVTNILNHDRLAWLGAKCSIDPNNVLSSYTASTTPAVFNRTAAGWFRPPHTKVLKVRTPKETFGEVDVKTRCPHVI